MGTMKTIVASIFAAFGLVGCASEPTWNMSEFPPQPMYGAAGAAAVATVAEAPVEAPTK
jgi:hypothetical protein